MAAAEFPSEGTKRKQEGHPSRQSASKHFKTVIEPRLQQHTPFWFKIKVASDEVEEAWEEAGEGLDDDDSENKIYHPRVLTALNKCLPAKCAAGHTRFSATRARACEKCFDTMCNLPRFEHTAASKAEGFGDEFPDLLWRRHGWILNTDQDALVSPKVSGYDATAIIEIKIAAERQVAFKPADIEQAVRYAWNLLDAQPLRDQVTVCLLTIRRVMFVRVFRHDSDIQMTRPESVMDPFRGPGVGQLHAFLTASDDDHGVRKIVSINGYVPVGPLRGVDRVAILGSGSFSDVVVVRKNAALDDGAWTLDDEGLAAAKVYQRMPTAKSGFDCAAFKRELELLEVQLATTGHVPTVVGKDPLAQVFVMQPVLQPITSDNLTGAVIAAIVAALQAVHVYCIHRDVRASNLMLSRQAGQPLVYVIDWNLGITLTEGSAGVVPKGAICVHGHAVNTARASNDAAKYKYTPAEDLQSLVRAVYLLLHNSFGPVVETTASLPVQLGAWRRFWDVRLRAPAPTPAGQPWCTAETQAVAGEYAAVADALSSVAFVPSPAE